MKRYLVFIMILTLFIISACTSTKTLEEFYTEANIGHVDQISIQNETDNTSIEITDRDEVNDFLSLIKDIEFVRQKDQGDNVNSKYKITLSNHDNEKKFEFLLNKIGDTYYETTSNIFRIVDQYYLEFNEK